MAAEPLDDRVAISSTDLDRVRDLYEKGLYQQSYRLADQQGLFRGWPGVEAAVMAGRLANHLGAPKLARRFHLRAFRKNPRHTEARYYFVWIVLEMRGPLEAWKILEGFGDLSGLLPQELADMFSLKSRAMATLRDFEAAEHWQNEAERLAPRHAWLQVERSYLFEAQDRYQEALTAARNALEITPWYRPAVQSVAHLLQLLGRNEESLALLEEAARHLESSAVVSQLAVQQLDMQHYSDARKSFETFSVLCPLMEKEIAEWLTVRRADIAYYLGDFASAAVFARQSENKFYKEFADNLESAAGDAQLSPAMRRVKLPVGFVRQHHMTCAPATLSAISRFWERPAEHLSVAENICYDGTPAHSERSWAEQNGWFTREFKVTEESARVLVDRGVPFTLTTSEAASAHLQAVIGYDVYRGSLLIRDPYFQHNQEFHLKPMLERYNSTGPRGMALVPGERRELIATLELPEAGLYDQLNELQRALFRHDRPQAQKILAAMETQVPDHRLALAARRSLAAYDSNPTETLASVDGLLKQFPEDANLQLTRASCLRDLARREERLAYLKELSCKKKSDPVFWLEYAYELGADVREHAATTALLRRASRLRPIDANNLYLSANLLWNRREFAKATELYRFAACLDDKKEFLATSYFSACWHLKQTKTALALLTDRFQRFGKLSHRPACSLFWAYAQLDQTTSALSTLENALQLRPNDGELLLFAADNYAHYGDFERAETLLKSARGKTRETTWMRTSAALAKLRGEIPAALAIWQEILKIEPLAFDAHRSVAQFLGETRGRSAALEHLKTICHRFPHNFGLHRLWNEWMVDESAVAKEAVVRRLVEINPVDPWSQRELVVCLGNQSRFPEAFSVMERALELDPNSAQTYGVRGWLCRSCGRTDEAAENYRRSIELSVDNGDSISGLLEVCHSLAERKKALAFIEQELIRQVVFGEELLAFRDVAIGILQPEELLKSLRFALKERPDLWHAWSAVTQQLTNLAQHNEALTLAQEATAQFPLQSRLWEDLARVHQARLNHPGEIAALEQALQINPLRGYAARELADAHERAGQLDRAVAIMEKAVVRAPMDGFNQGKLADLLWKTGARTSAIETIEKALRISPGHDWAWRLLSSWSTEEKQPQRAINLARDLTVQRSGEARSWLCLVEMLARPEDLAERMSALDQAIKLNPRSDRAYDLRAQILATSGRYDESIAACRPEMFGNDIPVSLRARAAWIEVQRGKPALGIKLMREVLAEDPSYVWGWRQLTDWLWASDAHEEALRAGQKLAELSPLDPIPLGYLGEARLRLGDRRGAKSDFLRAMKMDPAYTFAGFALFDMQLEDDELDAAEKTLATIRGNDAGGLILARKVQLATRRGQRKRVMEMLAELCANQSAKPDAVLNAGITAIKHGWHHDAEKVFDAALKKPDAHSRTGQLWVRSRFARSRWQGLRRLNRLVERGELGRRAITTYLELLGQTYEQRRQRRDIISSLTLRVLFSRTLTKNREWLRKDDETWGAVGYGFVCMRKYGNAIVWMADYKARTKAQQWMLHNLVVSLQQRGRGKTADEVVRHALNLPGSTQVESGLRLLAALEDVLSGRVEFAAELIKALQKSKLPIYESRVRALVQSLGGYRTNVEPKTQLWQWHAKSSDRFFKIKLEEPGDAKILHEESPAYRQAAREFVA